MADPPSLVGAVKVIVIALPLLTATTSPAADGAPAGVTAADAEESADRPIVVSASTLNV